MITMAAIRQYIADLGVAADGNVYVGALDSKQLKSIGVYSRQANGAPEIALGGISCTVSSTKPVSILVHWTKSATESEAAAYALYDKLLRDTRPVIGGTQVRYLRLMVPHPQDTGPDDTGVHEYVIWFDLIHERKE